VVVGYPEKVDLASKWPASPEYYDSALIVNGDGETVGNYRKTHLYTSDEAWALEGSEGFFNGTIEPIDNAILGISMDIKYASRTFFLSFKTNLIVWFQSVPFPGGLAFL
jgi:predicted amidohydrolase